MNAYPSHLEQRHRLKDGTEVTIRPIRPEDAAIEQEFVRALSDESRYFRFMDTIRELSPRMLAHFTRVDYERHLALIAVAGHGSGEKQVAVARYIAADDGASCEFAIAVADPWQRRGLGTRLMEALMAAARSAGIRTMHGEVLAANRNMLKLMARMGFDSRFERHDPRVIRVEKKL